MYGYAPYISSIWNANAYVHSPHRKHESSLPRLLGSHLLGVGNKEKKNVRVVRLHQKEVYDDFFEQNQQPVTAVCCGLLSEK